MLLRVAAVVKGSGNRNSWALHLCRIVKTCNLDRTRCKSAADEFNAELPVDVDCGIMRQVIDRDNCITVGHRRSGAIVQDYSYRAGIGCRYILL